MFSPLRVRMFIIYLLSFLVINLHLATLVACFSSSFYSNSTSNNTSNLPKIFCHEDESSALLHFKNSFTMFENNTLLASWKKGTDCCEWRGIFCDPISYHVVELELQSVGLIGSLDSNSTLFLLHHLRFLDLAANDFSYSPISPLFGLAFPHLTYLDLRFSNFSGQVPLEISQLSKLQSLRLGSYSLMGSSRLNPLKMKMSIFDNIIANMTELREFLLLSVKLDSTFPPSLTNLSSLTAIFFEDCNLRGELPVNILNMPQLQSLVLDGNDGLDAHFPLSNWSSPLQTMALSSVNFSSKLPSSPLLSQYNKLEVLSLSGCSFHGQIPSWMWNISMGLQALDLSDNSFSGNINLNHISSNLHKTSTLEYLILSHNYLTGSLTTLPWSTLQSVDLSYNMFEGPLPILPISIRFFAAANNKFTGSLHSSLCNLTSLLLLDLPNNDLKGELPHCLGNMSNLGGLNLGSNIISGTLPASFTKGCGLQFLDLSSNLFQGSVPPSLAHCINLQVLNLKRNKLRDEFPYWLGTLSHIQALLLSSNDFYGPLPLSKTNNSFPMLQILDLSNNNFSGKIPIAYIRRFTAIMNITLSVGGLNYMSSKNHVYYYSITLTFKGTDLKYQRIIKSLATFDLSNNKFEGEIPDNIGELVSLRGLNLSHNQLTGPIPRSLGNLKLLDCLDLSSNKLTGQIPQELASVTFLEVFNVSENRLVGPIPHGNNFDTFSVDSYKGNLGLCGFPFSECGKHRRPRGGPSKGEPKDNDYEDKYMLSEWEVTMMGYAVGTLVGLAWGYYMLSNERPFWLVKLVHLIVLGLEKLFGRRRRRPTRGRN